MSNPLFDYLNSINHTKKDIMEDWNQNEYKPFMINRFLSGQMDTVLYANEMNMRYDLPLRMQYDYLRLSVRKKKRFSKFLKKGKEDNIEIIKEYYGFSEREARLYLDCVTDEHLENMKVRLQKGGKK